MNEEKLFRTVEKSDDSIVLKLYNDKITFGNYHKVGDSPYKWVNPRYKVDLRTGELVEHTIVDARRAMQSFRASLSRSLRKICEIDEKNKFSYFLTFTFNAKYVNRKSAEECYTAYRNIIKRLKYQYGELQFLTVPEFHYDESIHFHAVFNFLERLPKLKYHRERGGYYTIVDKFKKEDCFIVVEKLQTNNIDYLVKYFTKTGNFPLARRFSCSRNLNRSRAVTSVRVYPYEFGGTYKRVMAAGATVKYGTSWRCSLAIEEKPHGDAPQGGAVDLFIKDTKDENPKTIQEIWDELMQKLRNTREIERKIYGIERGEGKDRPRRHRVQLAFDLV